MRYLPNDPTIQATDTSAARTARCNDRRFFRRDEGMLDSALNAPFQTFDGKDVYPALQQKAAHLCFGLVKNHPFVDGNKRIGAHVMLVFLALNGIELQYSQTELSDVILQLAAGEIKSSDLLHWILAHQV